MAIGHISVRLHNRGKGHSAAAAVAYRLGMDLDDVRTGERHCYARRTKRNEIESTGITTGAAVLNGREYAQRMANHIERTERRKRSNILRDIQVAIPHELDTAERRALLEAFSKDVATEWNTVAIFAIHAPDGEGDARNWHGHVVIPTRNRDGQKLRTFDDFRTGPDEIRKIRKLWENHANAALEKAKRPERVHTGQGTEAPAPTLGHKRTSIERRVRTEGHWEKNPSLFRRHRAPERRKIPPQSIAQLVMDGRSVTGTGRRLERHTRAKLGRESRDFRVPAIHFTPSRGPGRIEEMEAKKMEQAVRALLGAADQPRTPEAPDRSVASQTQSDHSTIAKRRERPPQAPNPPQNAQRGQDAQEAPKRRRRRNADRKARIVAARARQSAEQAPHHGRPEETHEKFPERRPQEPPAPAPPPSREEDEAREHEADEGRGTQQSEQTKPQAKTESESSTGRGAQRTSEPEDAIERDERAAWEARYGKDKKTWMKEFARDAAGAQLQEGAPAGSAADFMPPGKGPFRSKARLAAAHILDHALELIQDHKPPGQATSAQTRRVEIWNKMEETIVSQMVAAAERTEKREKDRKAILSRRGGGKGQRK